MRRWSERTGILQKLLVLWLGIQPSKYYDWRHWHTDITYLNICGTFYYLLLAGRLQPGDRALGDPLEITVQRALERYPGERPRIISDNGPQFIARDFKTFVREVGPSTCARRRTIRNRTARRNAFFENLKGEALRPNTPLPLQDARRVVARFAEYHNERRLHSAIGYIAPHDMLAGRAEEIHAAHDRKLAAARERRAAHRRVA